MSSQEENRENTTWILYNTMYRKLWELIKTVGDANRISLTESARKHSICIHGADDGEKPLGLWEFKTIQGETQEQILFIR